ncbi:MAG TPA: hypothetical protein VLV83_14315 [Acidobacteriota bacterium]|nr:hypothetical protein [Acidobacteriota bacterium]
MFKKQMMGCRLLHVAVLQGEWPKQKPQQPEIREQEATDFPQWFAEHATRTYDGDVDLADYNVGLALTSIDTSTFVFDCPSGPKQKGLKPEEKFRRKNDLAELIYEVKQMKWEKGQIDFEVSGKGRSRFKPVHVSFQDEHSLTLKAKVDHSDRGLVFVFTPMARWLVMSPSDAEETADFEPGRLIKRVNPDHPGLFRGAAPTEYVIFDVPVSREGIPLVEDARVLHCSHAVFARKTFEALKQWRYSSPKVNGEPVVALTSAVFAFRTR